jgi:hypothetical protein
MRKLTHRLVLALCLLLFNSQAQNYFNNRYDNTGSFDLTVGLDTFQNKYLAVGAEGFSGFNIALSLYLFNQDGTVFRKKTFGWNGDNLEAPNSHYIRQGTNQFYAAGSWVYHGYNSKAFLWRFDSNLDSLRFLTYGYPYSNNMINTFIKHTDNKIYMLGYVDDTLQSNADILLIKTDTAGNEIWKKKIGLTNMDENAISIDTLQGDLIVGGLRIGHHTSNTDAFVMRLDTAGNIVWQKIINTNGGYSASKVLTLKDGNILVHNRLKMYDAGSFTFNRFLIQKITPSNTLVWQKIYNSPNYGADGIVALENTQGNIVIAGQKGSTNYSCLGTINVLNQNGDSLFYKEFYKELGSQNYFRHVIQTQDKGYCFAGFLIPVFANGGTGNQDLWLLKVDSNFCESALPCNSVVGINEPVELDGEVSLYPNPSNGILNIQFITTDELKSNLNVTITNSLGQTVLSEAMNKQNSALNIEHLSDGLYYVTVKTKNKTFTQKIVVQK